MAPLRKRFVIEVDIEVASMRVWEASDLALAVDGVLFDYDVRDFSGAPGCTVHEVKSQGKGEG